MGFCSTSNFRKKTKNWQENTHRSTKTCQEVNYGKTEHRWSDQNTKIPKYKNTKNWNTKILKVQKNENTKIQNCKIQIQKCDKLIIWVLCFPPQWTITGSQLGRVTITISFLTRFLCQVPLIHYIFYFKHFRHQAQKCPTRSTRRSTWTLTRPGWTRWSTTTCGTRTRRRSSTTSTGRRRKWSPTSTPTTLPSLDQLEPATDSESLGKVTSY